MTMVFRNERYNKSTDRDGRAAWRCVKRNKGCRSVVVTFMGAVVQCTEHNHEFVASLLRARFCTRETTNIYIGGHKFFRHSRSLVGNRIRWTCAKKHKHKCKASAVTIDGIVVSTTGLHSHT